MKMRNSRSSGLGYPNAQALSPCLSDRTILRGEQCRHVGIIVSGFFSNLQESRIGGGEEAKDGFWLVKPMVFRR